MNRDTYNNQKITRYLLGSLPEADAEQFDELSFTDDEFSDALKSAEKDLVDAYVRSELSEKDLEKFETHYLASPRRREKVEFAKTFQVYAEKNFRELSASEQSKPKRNFSKWLAALNIFTGGRALWQLGLAAAVLVLMILGGRLWLENNRLREQSSETQAKRDALAAREQELQKQLETSRTENTETEKELARVREEREALERELNDAKSQKEQLIAEQKKRNELPPVEAKQTPLAPIRPLVASFMLAPSLRGGAQIKDLVIPPKTGLLRFGLQLEADDYPAYQVALVDQSTNQTVWQSGKLKTKATAGSKTLNLVLPAKLVKPKIYSLEVSGISAGGSPENISSYPFRVVPQ
jgi:hypothetical protein